MQWPQYNSHHDINVYTIINHQDLSVHIWSAISYNPSEKETVGWNWIIYGTIPSDMAAYIPNGIAIKSNVFFLQPQLCLWLDEISVAKYVSCNNWKKNEIYIL